MGWLVYVYLLGLKCGAVLLLACCVYLCARAVMPRAYWWTLVSRTRSFTRQMRNIRGRLSQSLIWVTAGFFIFLRHMWNGQRQNPAEMGDPNRPGGLINQARTCYLNSMLQALYMTPEFRNGINDIGTHVTNSPVTKKLRSLFQRMELNPLPASTAKLTSVLGIEVTQERDVQEFWHELMNKLQNEGPEQAHLIAQLYEGELKDYVMCKQCGEEDARTTSCFDIPLVVRPFGSQRSYGSIEDSLAAFVQPQLLTGDNQSACKTCQRKCDAQKGLMVTRLPYILTLHLMRFDIDCTTGRRIKLNDRMTFPEMFDANGVLRGCTSDMPNEGPSSTAVIDVEPDSIHVSMEETTESATSNHEVCAQGRDHSASQNDPIQWTNGETAPGMEATIRSATIKHEAFAQGPDHSTSQNDLIQWINAELPSSTPTYTVQEIHEQVFKDNFERKENIETHESRMLLTTCSNDIAKQSPLIVDEPLGGHDSPEGMPLWPSHASAKPTPRQGNHATPVEQYAIDKQSDAVAVNMKTNEFDQSREHGESAADIPWNSSLPKELEPKSTLKSLESHTPPVGNSHDACTTQRRPCGEKSTSNAPQAVAQQGVNSFSGLPNLTRPASTDTCDGVFLWSTGTIAKPSALRRRESRVTVRMGQRTNGPDKEPNTVHIDMTRAIESDVQLGANTFGGFSNLTQPTPKDISGGVYLWSTSTVAKPSILHMQGNLTESMVCPQTNGQNKEPNAVHIDMDKGIDSRESHRQDSDDMAAGSSSYPHNRNQQTNDEAQSTPLRYISKIKDQPDFDDGHQEPQKSSESHQADAQLITNSYKSGCNEIQPIAEKSIISRSKYASSTFPEPQIASSPMLSGGIEQAVTHDHKHYQAKKKPNKKLLHMPRLPTMDQQQNLQQHEEPQLLRQSAGHPGSQSRTTLNTDLREDSRQPAHAISNYDVFAVLVHEGDTSSGHYTVYVKSLPSGQWYRCDSSNVEQTSIDEVRGLYGGGQYSAKSTYMLMYRRKDPHMNQGFIRQSAVGSDAWALCRERAKLVLSLGLLLLLLTLLYFALRFAYPYL